MKTRITQPSDMRSENQFDFPKETKAQSQCSGSGPCSKPYLEVLSTLSSSSSACEVCTQIGVPSNPVIFRLPTLMSCNVSKQRP